jgi:hypothetical protein
MSDNYFDAEAEFKRLVAALMVEQEPPALEWIPVADAARLPSVETRLLIVYTSGTSKTKCVTSGVYDVLGRWIDLEDEDFGELSHVTHFMVQPGPPED